MSAISHPPELDLLRKQVADLARELTERDQAFRYHDRPVDGELEDPTSSAESESVRSYSMRPRTSRIESCCRCSVAASRAEVSRTASMMSA